jgi:hypothetical protein
MWFWLAMELLFVWPLLEVVWVIFGPSASRNKA